MLNQKDVMWWGRENEGARSDMPWQHTSIEWAITIGK